MRPPRPASAFVPTSRRAGPAQRRARRRARAPPSRARRPRTGRRPPLPRPSPAPHLRTLRHPPASGRAARQGAAATPPHRDRGRVDENECDVGRRGEPNASSAHSSVVNAAVRRSTISEPRRPFKAADAAAISSPSARRRAAISSRACKRASGAASDSRASTVESSDGKTSIGRGDRVAAPRSPGGSNDGSCFRIACSSARSVGVGSIPLLDERVPGLTVDAERVGLPA